jgi:ATP-dependent helicase/nuclease subunit B
VTAKAASGANVLWIVPSERHIERWARDGRKVETRASLRGRLFDELVRDRSLATPAEARLALAEALPAIAASDPLLARFARGRGDGRLGGGESWERTLDAVDGSIGALRTAGVRAESLARVGRSEQGAAGSRARMLLLAVRAVDAVLEARGLVDPRGMGVVLAERIALHPAGRVASVVGAKGVIARFVLGWEGADVAWWRALDAALVRAGGEGTRAELPSFEESIDAARERGPLDVVSEDVARALDAPPRGIPIEAPLGDLRLVGAAIPERARANVECRTATDVEAQARAALDVVRRALLAGSGVEEIAITAGELDDVAVAALRRAFDDERIPLHDARGEAPALAGIVGFALGALALADGGLGRLDVAALARSGYLDPERLGVDARALGDLAYALERTPTVAGVDARASIEATARASVAALNRGGAGEKDALLADARASLAVRLADIALPAARSMRRLEHVAVARALFSALGIDPLRERAVSAALASDEPPRGTVRAMLRAVARDAHAWELLEAALSDYEAAIARLGLVDAVVGPRAFRHELAHALDARAGRPTAARAGAVRVANLEELAVERLALLVIIDANEGRLPSRGGRGRGPGPDARDAEPVHEGLASALRAIDPVYAPPSSAVRAARQLTSLALAVMGAQSIVLTRRSRDEEGALMAPSPVVAWLERGGVRTSVWRASPLDGRAVCAHEAELRRAARGGLPRGSVARRARIERTREARFEATSPPADPILGDLDDGALAPGSDVLSALFAETGGGERPLAVTNLERFAVCPFQGFAAQVLHARPERPLRELPDRRESGTLIHRALAAAFTATAPLWSERPRRAALIQERAREGVELVLQQETLASPLRRLALARVRDAVRAVVTWSLADLGWDFALAEQSFGDLRAVRAGAWPPLVLEDGGVHLALRGSIDRVDVGRERAAVRATDYKTSPRAAESGMRALGETAFQVALYARAAGNALQRPERAGLYVGATRPDDVGPKVKKDFDAAWTALHSGAPGRATPIEVRALDVIRRVRQGGLAPRPHDDSACATCDSSGGCRKPRFAIARDDEDASARG